MFHIIGLGLSMFPRSATFFVTNKTLITAPVFDLILIHDLAIISLNITYFH